MELKETGKPPSDPSGKSSFSEAEETHSAEKKKVEFQKKQADSQRQADRATISDSAANYATLSQKMAQAAQAAEMKRKKSSKELRGDKEASEPEEPDTVHFSSKAEESLTRTDKFKHRSNSDSDTLPQL